MPVSLSFVICEMGISQQPQQDLRAECFPLSNLSASYKDVHYHALSPLSMFENIRGKKKKKKKS